MVECDAIKGSKTCPFLLISFRNRLNIRHNKTDTIHPRFNVALSVSDPPLWERETRCCGFYCLHWRVNKPTGVGKARPSCECVRGDAVCVGNEREGRALKMFRIKLCLIYFEALE